MLYQLSYLSLKETPYIKALQSNPYEVSSKADPVRDLRAPSCAMRHQSKELLGVANPALMTNTQLVWR